MLTLTCTIPLVLFIGYLKSIFSKFPKRTEELTDCSSLTSVFRGQPTHMSTHTLVPNWQEKKREIKSKHKLLLLCSINAVFSPLSISLSSQAGHIMMLNWLHSSPVKMGQTHYKLV